MPEGARAALDVALGRDHVLPMTSRPLLLLSMALGACRLAGPEPLEPEGALPPVVVQPGPITRAEQAEALRLFRVASSSFESRRYFEVLRTTSEILERFPASDVSGAAVLLTARAELQNGSAERADAAAERYVRLLRPGDPRSTRARLLQAQAWEGDPAEQLDRLLRIDRSATAAEVATAVPLARGAADQLDPAELEAVLAAAPTDGPLAPIAEARHAANLLQSGDAQRATRLAEAALDAGASGPDSALAVRVLRGELPEGRGGTRSFAIATVLPNGGPPALSEFASLVAEGVEVAAATVLGPSYRVTIEGRDDRGDPALDSALVVELEAGSVAGAVGFLEDTALVAAGRARQEALPIVSPTARSAEAAGEGVYSLEGPDPEAARSMARYAASRAYQRVAIVLPQSASANEEADAFEEEATSLGIPVVGRYPYEPGATFFESQILGAQDALRAEEIAALRLGEDDTLRVEMLDPVAIFLPVPAEDVEYVAPQLAHFALDTLAIELMGTSGWTNPQILELVEPRYTTGVVATTPSGTGPGSPGRRRFEEAYEEHFQRTLVSPTPAIGYDAALLLLEALRPGRLEPAEVRIAFENLRDIEGATGIFSTIDDRLVRRTEVVRIDNRILIPVPVG